MYRRYKLSAITAWFLCAAVCLGAIISVAALLIQNGQSESALKLAGGVVWILFTVPFAITAAMIISRQPGNMIGWLLMEPALLLIVVTPVDAYLKTILSPPAAPGFLLLVLIWFSNWDWLALIFPILLIALLFPDGRPPSARWRWVLILAAVFCAFFLLIATFAKKLGPVNADWTVSNPIGFLDESQIQTIIGPWLAVMILITVLCAASLVVRYRRANNGERKQIKWLMYAGCVFTVIYVQGTWINDSGSGDNFISNLYNLLLGLAILTFPISIAIAILRHHLWDIDLIIRRTIQYGLLTILLGLIYFGMVVMLGQAFRSFTGQESSLAVVLSTLAIAGLFSPLRRRLQTGIDRRFYRQKYDAENAVSAFSTAVRSEVKVEVLSNLLADAAREAFQPETVSLWLRKD